MRHPHAPVKHSGDVPPYVTKKGGHPMQSDLENPLDMVDSEERKIFRQSLPAEAVTRDFLQSLLEEHQSHRQDNAFARSGKLTSMR